MRRGSYRKSPARGTNDTMTRTSSEGKKLTATVLNIQRMSTEDGPGIRTTVFFKGCGLACAWCHNPESISGRPQVQWIENRCIGCATCVEACPEGALRLDGSGMTIDRDICTGCGICADVCPSTAMELLGKEWELEMLVREVEKDRAYFEQSGGGITASGGEPTVQAPFVSEFLRHCRERGLHTALDTCGYASRRSLEAVLPHADLVLFDLKIMDSEEHRRRTGALNERILENLLFVRDFKKGSGRPLSLWIRTPLIPGATATVENLTAIAGFIAENLAGSVERWELCSFNNLCRDKYRRLGMEWEFQDTPLLSRSSLDELVEAARKMLPDPSIAQWTGAPRVEKEAATVHTKGHLKLVKGCATC
ncbi:MAG: 4-hydroxyphenylacetate decarboxylase activating enzyme [Spirochaetes bacterium ADurb.BinA120]|nr:MAG: 4-hydroxyphenylacetate decarboxylase activating enzyme [Spirochaetes bacterium ADurb.BinA120]